MTVYAWTSAIELSDSATPPVEALSLPVPVSVPKTQLAQAGPQDPATKPPAEISSAVRNKRITSVNVAANCDALGPCAASN